MKYFLLKVALISAFFFAPMDNVPKEFSGKAYYFTKSKMELGSWGARMSEAQKKETYARLKNRLEKNYILSFNKDESVFIEEDQVDAMSGATDSWGDNFTRGTQYKNVTENQLIQSQEFYGKKFLVKDQLQPIDWKMGTETKQIGQYMCFKATASIPSEELAWYDFSWGDLRKPEPKEGEQVPVAMTEVEAWFTLQIPVKNGPAEYWGLPGLILEVSAGNTVMLCSKIVLNTDETLTIEAPDKGKEITKADYRATIIRKMTEMRDNRGRRRG